MAGNHKARIAALEAVSVPKVDMAERMRRARERRHAMTLEEVAANRQAWLERAAMTPAPEPGTLARRLWDAAQRELRRGAGEVVCATSDRVAE